MISKCPTCLTYRNRQTSEAPIQPKLPDYPWIKCLTDIFRLQGHYYLLIVDYYSKFIAVKHLQSDQNGPSSAEKLLGQKLRKIFNSLIPSTKVPPKKSTPLSKKLRQKLPEIAPGKTVWVWINEQNLWAKKGISLWVKIIAQYHTIFWTKEETY